MNPNTLHIRQATPEDVPLILAFIKELAEYEKLAHAVVATEESLMESFFGQKSNAYALIGEYEAQPIAFAVYYFSFSTFMGKKGLYLDDLFVKPAYRSKGFGKTFITHLAKIAEIEKCGRFEWIALDWNTPAIDFYRSIGAMHLEDWIIFRVTADQIPRLANMK